MTPDTSVLGVPPVQVTPQTRFQQNYRVATAVEAGLDVVAVRNGRGDVELFTLGNDNTVWNFYPDPHSDTGYTGVSTGLRSGPISVGVDSQGNIVLFTTLNVQLFYSVETPGSPSRWSTPVQIAVPQPDDATAIVGILTRRIAGQLYVAALTKYTNAFGPAYSLAYSLWDKDKTFRATPVTFSSTNCVWLGHNAETAAIACVDQIIAAFMVESGTVYRYPMATTFTARSVAAAPDRTGNDAIVAVLADGNAYRLIGGANGQPYDWMQLSHSLALRQIIAETDENGNVPIFAVSGNNRLYHWQPLPSSPTGYSDPPIAIYTDTARVAGAADDDGDIDLFAAGTAQNTLSHIFQEQTSTNWVREAVEVPSTGHVEEYPSYSTDLTFADSEGALLTFEPATVTSSEQARVTINGSTYLIDPHRPARVSTNAAAILSIAQQTGSLAAPTLQIALDRMPPGESIALAQSVVTEDRLRKVTGTDILNAKDAKGFDLLAPPYRNEETAKSLASAANRCMSLPAVPGAPAALLSRSAQTPACVWYRQGGSASSLPNRIAPANEQFWQITFDADNVSFRTLTASDAAALLAFKRASLPNAAGLFDWIEDVGDFAAGVVDKTIQIVDTVVTAVGDVVHAAFTFIAEGVRALYEAVVSTIEQAFDIVEAFFAEVGVFFEQLFEWLGFLFAWRDMLLTHEALAYTIQQLIDFIGLAAGGMQRIFDNGIEDVQSRLAQLFENAERGIAGSSSIGGYEKAHTPPSPELSAATSNTVIGSAILDNVHGITAMSALQSAIDTSPIDEYIEQLQQFADSSESGQAFKNAIKYFNDLGGSIDQIFSQLLAAMMEVVQGVLQMAVSGAKAILDGLFKLVQTLISSIKSALGAAWDIPLVSDLYEWLTGSSLTTIDLIALLVAVPSTILYKAKHDAAPFTDASLEAFKKSFNAQSLLQASHLGENGPVRDGLITEVSPVAAALLSIATAVSTIFYGALSALQDGLGDEAPDFLAKVTLVLELAAQGASCPWLTSSTAVDCVSAAGTAALVWIYGCVGCLLDSVFAAVKTSDKVQTIIGFLCGCGQLIVSIIASIKAEALAIAAYMVSCVPPLARVALLSKDPKVAAVVASIDALFYTAAAILGVVQPAAVEREEPVLVMA